MKVKVRELIEKLEELNQEEEIVICERAFNDQGDVIHHSYYSIGNIEQWSDCPGASHHYTIFGDELISG